MSRPPIMVLAWLVAFLAALAAPLATADAKTPRRYAWAGLERGPLAPAPARALEALLVDELDGYDAFRLVDASGHALDRRLLGSEAALVAELKDAGIDLFLRFKHKAALKKFSQAVAIFESRLVTLQDYELLHDTLLAKAEAEYQSGEAGTAKATLKNLLALGPRKTPSADTHPAKFVKLWQAAKREIGAVGTISVECTDPGCIVFIDGQRLGEAPLLATRIRPGKHYVVATWPHGVLKTTVHVAAGKEAKARLSRSGPAEEARRALMDVVRRRLGPAAAPEHATRIASLARASTILIAAVGKDAAGKQWLFIARHAANGQLVAVGRAPLDEAVDSETVAKNVKRLCAALFVDGRHGEFSVDSAGALIDVVGLAESLYASRYTEAAPPPTLDGSPPPPPPPPSDLIGIVAPPPSGGEDDGVLSKWWFWAIVGGVAAAGATTAGIVLLSPSPTTTNFEVRLP